jgi:hypothetical protein
MPGLSRDVTPDLEKPQGHPSEDDRLPAEQDRLRQESDTT